jgi:hypothetical protein
MFLMSVAFLLPLKVVMVAMELEMISITKIVVIVRVSSPVQNGRFLRLIVVMKV